MDKIHPIQNCRQLIDLTKTSGVRTQRRLWRTWRTVAAPAREGMASGLHYSPTSSEPGFFYRSSLNLHDLNNTSTPTRTELTRVFDRVLPNCCPPSVCCRKGKVFDSLAPGNDSLPRLVGLHALKPPSPVLVCPLYTPR